MVLTWTFALLYLHEPTLPVAIAFCVLNSLHGIFVLVYYCVRNQKVREPSHLLSRLFLLIGD